MLVNLASIKSMRIFEHIRLLCLTVLTTSVMTVSLFAQKTNIYLHEDAEFKKALELFEKEKYGAARRSFEKVIATHNKPNDLLKEDAEYYTGVCAIELFNKDGQLLLREFVKEHPGHPKVKRAAFYLGKYNYRKEKYEEALHWFSQSDIYELNKNEKDEFLFKQGYSLLQLDSLKEAKKNFYEIQDTASKYHIPALYYFSYITYTEKSYETALQGFLKLTTDETFGSVVPYYIAQIYFLQKKYEKVIEYAPPLLDTAGRRVPEIARIMGESHYRLSHFREAIPYLKRYEKEAGLMNRHDAYQLAYCLYRTNETADAIKYFKQVATADQDSLTQNALYHLGDCYVKTGNKQFARGAFDIAAGMDHDRKIKESAHFNYAKLCYELSFNPYSEAINAFQDYITKYPNSVYIDDAYEFLVNAYMTTRNYEQALASIESIKALSDAMKPSYQRIAYYRGVDVFNGRVPLYEEAIKLFDKSHLYNYDKQLTALAHFWKGECYYRLGDFDKAIANYIAFTMQPGAFSLAEHDRVYYNTGYAYFKKGQFNEAGTWFRKFLASGTAKTNQDMAADAIVRTGDAYFMLRNYSNAIQFYSDAIAMKHSSVDYAIYQRSLAYGLTQQYEQKVAGLENLLNTFPNTSYAAASKFELGETNFKHIKNTPQALVWYKKVNDEHPASNYANKSLLQTGLAYYNLNQPDEALNAFDRVVKMGTNENTAEALNFIERIYIAKEDVDGWERYLKGMGVDYSSASSDSVRFEIGKSNYLKKDCDRAIKNFEDYLAKYPTGIFSLEANFYLAQCEFRKGNTENALKSYEFVLTKQQSEFYPQALQNAAAIYYSDKKFEQALDKYKGLETIAESPAEILFSRSGQMRCAFYLKQYDAAIVHANNVLTSEKLSDELKQESHFIIGRSSFETEKFDMAESELAIVKDMQGNEMAAEAFYHIAYIQYLKARFRESEQTIFEFINKNPAYPFWMAKALILLSDNYVILGDNFQAKHTLNTIIENSDIKDIVEQAKEKLNRIEESEKIEKQQLPVDQIKVEYKNDPNSSVESDENGL